MLLLYGNIHLLHYSEYQMNYRLEKQTFKNIHKKIKLIYLLQNITDAHLT